jgi:signal transduction histidine kinase
MEKLGIGFPQRAADKAAALAASTLDAPMASVEVIHEGYVHLVALQTKTGAGMGGKVPLGMHPCHQAAREKAVCRLNEAGRVYPSVPWFDAHGVSSYIAVPVLAQDGSLLAYLGAMDPAPSAFEERHVNMLWEVARRAAKDFALLDQDARRRAMAEGAHKAMAMALLGLTDEEEVAEKTLDCLLSLMLPGLAPSAALFAYDKAAEQLMLLAHKAPPHDVEECPRKVGIRQCVCGAVVESQKPLLVPNAHSHPMHCHSMAHRTPHHDLCVPLVTSNNIVWGVLRIEAATPDLEEDVKTLVGELASLAAKALAGAAACSGRGGGEAQQAKIESLKTRARELQAALSQATRAKSDFLSGMSHELRTPLNAIIGFSQVLQEEYFGALNDKQKQYVKDILESGKHLLSLINDILDLSRVESGMMELDLAKVPLAPLLNGSLVMIREKAHSHGIRLEVEIDDFVRDLILVADERKLKQVLYNLLSNAVKFTPDGGTIRVGAMIRAEDTGDTDSRNFVEIFVSDTGIGVAPGDLKRVFEDFYQVKSGPSGKTPGAGLGLPLTRRLVEMHGGRIWVTSPGKDKGSRFAFTLPLDAAELAGPEPARPDGQ